MHNTALAQLERSHLRLQYLECAKVRSRYAGVALRTHLDQEWDERAELRLCRMQPAFQITTDDDRGASRGEKPGSKANRAALRRCVVVDVLNKTLHVGVHEDRGAAPDSEGRSATS